MIKLATPSFLATSEATQTSTKVAELTVNYQTSLGRKEVELEPAIPATEDTEEIAAKMGFIKMGYAHGWCIDSNGNNLFGNTTTDELPIEGDILGYYHKMFIEKLQKLNPKVVFVNTLA